ncbi:stalk domain-containing protein [Paenibacillus hexagrammi]|uniref:CAP domain-containing protein n=1 Tax=Paenibacillus hexagrammi TaxID=2908839 RepID=A0ABY3SAY8_9BACL|nr:stalk domain-containing protein [Paenibacillus sp. YPD9-1]UJF31169.1 CAP domain-containing protein [Paenibacillus sp. YPD9-1]
MKVHLRIKWLYRMLLIVCLVVSGLLPAGHPTYALSFGALPFPNGNVGITQPDIGAEIDLSEGKTPESYHFYLNNEEKPVIYDPVSVKYTYRPEAPLPPGEYTARLVFSFAGYQPASYDWKFTITAGASTLSTTVTKEQDQGLKAINDYRAKLGLAAVKFSDALNTAALKHAEYLDMNQVDPIHTSVSLHDENASLNGYIGNSVTERYEYVGYSRAGSEDVAYNEATLVEAIDSLFDAPYHRSPFMVPSLTEIGVYKKGNYHVIEFGYADGIAPEMTVSPGANDVYVPTSFDGHESPDPLRNYKSADYPVGYPIMAAVNGPKVKGVRLLESGLKDEKGSKVNILVNSPENDDHLENEVMLLPAKPLALDSTYIAQIKLEVTMVDGSTKQLEKEWSFRTEPVSGIGVKKLHQDAKAYTLQMANYGLNRNHTVTFGLDDDSYRLDLVSYPMMQKPLILDGTSYLYIRDLAAALGAEVEWDDSNKAAIYRKKDKTIIFYTNRNAYSINGQEFETSSPAQLYHETTMIPVRLLSETLGAKVSYYEPTRTVSITY